MREIAFAISHICCLPTVSLFIVSRSMSICILSKWSFLLLHSFSCHRCEFLELSSDEDVLCHRKMTKHVQLWCIDNKYRYPEPLYLQTLLLFSFIYVIVRNLFINICEEPSSCWLSGHRSLPSSKDFTFSLTSRSTWTESAWNTRERLVDSFHR